MLIDLLMHWLINEQGRSWKSEKISPTFHFYLVTERSYGLENKYLINSSHGLIWIGLWSFERSIYYTFWAQRLSLCLYVGTIEAVAVMFESSISSERFHSHEWGTTMGNKINNLQCFMLLLYPLLYLEETHKTRLKL